MILREIKRLDAKKPVIISMGDVAASGGYWIAMGGQRIFADNDTITGSIGVFGLLLNIQKIANNNGISTSLSTAGFPNVIMALVPGKEAARELGEKLKKMFKRRMVRD